VRLRPGHWDRVLADYRLGWEENNRQACLANLGPIASAGRALRAGAGAGKGADRGPEAQRLAEQLYAVRFFCPDGGRYTLSADGKECSCTAHGSARLPRQGLAPSDSAGPARALRDFGGLTATLTFLEDGLHAVLVLEPKEGPVASRAAPARTPAGARAPLRPGPGVLKSRPVWGEGCRLAGRLEGRVP
jgi:hypothetical protein